MGRELQKTNGGCPMKVGDWVCIDHLEEFSFCVPTWYGCIAVVEAIDTATNDNHYAKRGGKVTLRLVFKSPKLKSITQTDFPLSCLSVIAKREEIKNG
jgi:hypothetical protein